MGKKQSVAIPPLSPRRKRELERTLVEGLAERGIRAAVEFEKSALPGGYRLFVTSDDFDGLLDAERQDIVWRVIKEQWEREDQLRLTLTLMMTGREAAGTWS